MNGSVVRVQDSHNLLAGMEDIPYVRADIADEMLAALKQALVGRLTSSLCRWIAIGDVLRLSLQPAARCDLH